MIAPKRLIEVDLPIARISREARKEKTIRHGHISTLHIWWARRPLAACRAITLAALWPDPGDPACPEAFKDAVRTEMRSWRDRHGGAQRDWSDPVSLRSALLDFIGEFSAWDNSSDPEAIGVSRRLVSVAHEALGGIGAKPLVFDSFAGGGAIPLEALRVGADAFASDLNPVAVLLEKVVLEMIPRHGARLAEALDAASKTVGQRLDETLRRYYPDDPDGSRPLAYVWARTVLSNEPTADPPVEIPMLGTLVLSERAGSLAALRWVRAEDGRVQTRLATKIYQNGRSIVVRMPILEVFAPASLADVEAPPVSRGSVTCPVTGHAMSAEVVKAQFQGRRGGADDARMVAVVTTRTGRSGRSYREPTERDLDLVREASEELAELRQRTRAGHALVPDEELPYLRSIFNVQLLDIKRWGDLFSARQALTLATLVRLCRDLALPDDGMGRATRTLLALAIDRCADKFASIVRWVPGGEYAANVFVRQALGIVWDFAEVSPLSDVGWAGATEWIRKVVEENARLELDSGQAVLASATKHPLPDDSADVFFTDPPYYDAVPYADLSDFFYVWLKRAIGDLYPDLFGGELAPKNGEIVQLAERNKKYAYKTREYFQALMGEAMTEGRRVLRPGGVGVVVFAHKTTVGWETLLQSMVDAGWTVTASWPIDTEMVNRLRAKNSAALASSIHLVVRPRETRDGALDRTSLGDWRDVLAELPVRIGEWMPRLAREGVVGADAIFACLGPALEVFSRYSRVEKASGDVVSLREYLEHVWAAVAREALSLVFVETGATGLEEDARLTAMWLWTLRPSARMDEPTEIDADDEPAVAQRGGFALEYDAARKIAQGLGASLEALPTLVEIKGETARLLGIRERSRHLADAPAAGAAPSLQRSEQLKLFGSVAQAGVPAGLEIGEVRAGKTILDRLHQAMILFGSGRSDALARFLAEGPGSEAPFWSLAQSLSALYPSGTDEKRWVDGVLARKKSFGY